MTIHERLVSTTGWSAIFWLAALMIPLLTVSFVRGQEPGEKVVPGKQTLKSFNVPQSESHWNWAKEGVGTLGQIDAAKEGKKESVDAWIFVPTDESAKSDAGFPLLLFLHGAGERGANPEAVKFHGPPKLIETEKGKTWPFLTVSPQCHDGYRWSPDQLLALLDAVEKDYPVDKSRVYVTGLSMGGFGTWMLLDSAKDRFAAGIPICGGYDPKRAENLADEPIWAFHGEADGAVPVEMSKKMVQAIRDAGGKKVKLTTYPGVNHDCWTQTYDNPEIYRWLLEQHK